MSTIQIGCLKNKKQKLFKKITWIYENHFLHFKLNNKNNNNNDDEGSYNELCRKTVCQMGKGQSCCTSTGWTVVHCGNGGFFPFFLTILILFTFIPMRPMSFKQHGSGKGKLLRVLL